MAIKYIDSITYGSDEYKFVDDVSPDEIFWVPLENGSPSGFTTTVTPNELTTAINDGKIPVLKYYSALYYFNYCGDDDDYRYYFTASSDIGTEIFELIAASSSSASFSEINSSYIPYASTTGWYGTCSTGSTTTEKVVVCSDYILKKGNIIGVLFTNDNSMPSPTLNINSTGAKSIYKGSGIASNLLWGANNIIYFMYDGTYYRYITAVHADGPLEVWYGSCSTTASTATKAVTCNGFGLQKALLVINCTSANTFASGALSLNVNNTYAGTVYYNGAATSSSNTLLWDAGETLIFMCSTGMSGTTYNCICKSKSGAVTDVQVNGTSVLSSGVANIVTNTAYNASTNKIATMSDVESHGSTAVVTDHILYIVTDIQSGDEVNY